MASPTDAATLGIMRMTGHSIPESARIFSMGIPAICVGCCRFSGAHTREEYVETESLHSGLHFLFDLILQYF